MKVIRFMGLLALGAIGLVAWGQLVGSEPLRFGANAIPEKLGIGVIAYGYGVTVTGVILGSLYRELEARKRKNEQQISDFRSFLRNVFLSLDFWMSLCGSPIVYALLWKSLDGGSIAGLTTIALQNGFCCTVLVSNFVSSQGSTTPPQNTPPKRPKAAPKQSITASSNNDAPEARPDSSPN